MISSEVQRTLVKSAPELWAELSDPTALARHLGELGEIRITRIDREQKVEWEAGDTSGTVVIKPSNWGTKVKLTVTREIAEPEPTVALEAAAEPDAEIEASAEIEAEAEPEPTATAEPEPTATAEPEPEPEPIADAEREPIAQAAYGFFEEPEPYEAAHQTEPEPDLELESEFEFEPEPEFAPALELEGEPALEPRRGFFSRLFGRFRGEELVRNESHEAVAIGDSSPVEEFVEPSEDIVIAESSPVPADAVDAWATWASPPETAPIVEPQPRVEAIVEPEPELELEPSAEHTFEIGEAPIEHAHDADAIEAPVETRAGESHAYAEQSDSPATPATDMSAEIKAAEEVAAEEVTAVLTGVLDRLGAAHHRPFSRA